MEKLWAEKSKNGSMPSFQMNVLLPQIRKNFEVDEEAVDELVTELDKGEYSSCHSPHRGSIIKFDFALCFQRKTD